jgi:hypothetical protein
VLFEDLEKEVKQQGGQARVLAVKVEDARQEAEIVAQFSAQCVRNMASLSSDVMTFTPS